MEEFLQKSITFLKGVGSTNAAKLAKLGVFSVGSLLEYYPRRYEDRGNLKLIRDIAAGEYATFRAKVIDRRETKPNGALTITKIIVGDISGYVNLVWFNQPYQKNRYSVGAELVVSGKMQKKLQGLEINKPEIEFARDCDFEAGRIIPVYPACEELGQWRMRLLVKQVLEIFNANFAAGETLPDHVVKNCGLLNRQTAIQNIHFPQDLKLLQAARYRLAFEELYLMQCALVYLKQKNKHHNLGVKHAGDGELVAALEKSLPFALTGDQQKAVVDVKTDMEDVIPMQRLIQGDVGSGKTVVAAIALAKTVENGYQGAMMAPTEILAQQHFQSLTELMAPLGVKVALLTGKLAAKARREVLGQIAAGNVDIIIGTHALIQEGVEFQHLGLVITDEQHRFGVRQRAKLQGKGKMPDVLVMTATPIPRTMALTVYGDLDVSLIRELPPGRKQVATFARTGNSKEKVYQFAVGEIDKGRQVYVVCPLVEESEKIESKAAVEWYEELTGTYFKNIPCALLHGKMKPAAKEEVMNNFYGGKIKALVATTVIEVGVNVPNATVMIIEGAERFGLAQLHQLRGRVGRGAHKSYCILLSDSKTTEAKERLQAVVESADGFWLAEKDLVLRGAGQFFGTNQHGLPDLKVADIIKDVDILLAAREAALRTVNSAELLRQVERALKNYFGDKFSMIFWG
ncbi:MAG: ATP-dependent DNA helicase RecG [Sporomusaceae bacterium]|nr:ATP-dependent DNA helicase RecG [Sporomusaceae bacterium]